MQNVSVSVLQFLPCQKNSYEVFAITIMTILAPKLIINLRAEYYSQSDDGTLQLIWNADAPESFSSSGGVVTAGSDDSGVVQ